MQEFKYSFKNAGLYLIMGIILIILGLGAICIAILPIISQSDSHHYGSHYRGELDFIALFLGIGGLLTYFGASNFVTLVKQRAIKYIISDSGLICKEWREEYFIPFDSLSFSTTEMSAIISDRRNKKMITVTNDLEDYNNFLKTLKKKNQ